MVLAPLVVAARTGLQTGWTFRDSTRQRRAIEDWEEHTFFLRRNLDVAERNLELIEKSFAAASAGKSRREELGSLLMGNVRLLSESPVGRDELTSDRLLSVALRLEQAEAIDAGGLKDRTVCQVQHDLVRIARDIVMAAERDLAEASGLNFTPRPGDAQAVRLGHLLRYVRRASEVPVEELAARVGKSAPYLRMIERGEKVAAPGTYAAFLGALGYQVEIDEEADVPTVVVRDETATIKIRLESAAGQLERLKAVEERLRIGRSGAASTRRYEGILLMRNESALKELEMLRHALTLLAQADEPALVRMIAAFSPLDDPDSSRISLRLPAPDAGRGGMPSRDTRPHGTTKA